MWVAAGTRASTPSWAARQAWGLMIRAVSRRMTQAQTTRGRGSPACCGPALRSGRRRLLRQSPLRTGRGDVLLLQKVGPFAVCPGGANSACRLHPSSEGWQGARPLPLPGPWWASFADSSFVWSWRQKERKRSSGYERKRLLRRRKRKELFSFLS